MLNYCWPTFAQCRITLPSILQSYNGKVQGLDQNLSISFDECWQAQTATINPLDDTHIELMLQRLCSPAPQSYFVASRAVQQSARDVHERTSSAQKLSQLQYLVKDGYQWAETWDGKGFTVVATTDSTLADGWNLVEPAQDQQSTLDIAHSTLEFITNHHGGFWSTNNHDSRSELLHGRVETAKERLRLTLGTDMRGGSSAEAAFCFALAGVSDVELYEMLATIACHELRRIGNRRSFRSKNILHMVEKLAAAGVVGETMNKFYRVAAECLTIKGETLEAVELLCSNHRYNLLSTRPLLWLWRFASKQTKVAIMTPDNVNSPAYKKSRWIESLEDPSKSLVVDIGCGMGVSLLGLATVSGDTEFPLSEEGSRINFPRWKDSNFIGCDLSGISIGYASGISNRWNLDGRLQYVCQPGQDLLNSIKSQYPGTVSLVMIQFPSPYRINDQGQGNLQLPSVDSGFMVSEALLRAVAGVLSVDGLMLLQSNVEDVAITMQRLAENVGFESIVCPHACTLDDLDNAHLSRRSLEWIETQGKRAMGDNWSSVPLLPPKCATETEVACHFQDIRVHRCVLRLPAGYQPHG